VQQTVVRDYSSEKPASDAEFQILRRLYEYDPVPLDAVVERTDTFEHWVREVIAFDLPYGERGGAVLYVPRDAQPPYQAVVYWGGSGILSTKANDEEFLAAYDFIVRSGRVVAVPLFAGAYGRTDPRPTADWGTSEPGTSGLNAYRDIAIQWVKDLRTTIDYLESRHDIETDRMGYYGFSFGGRTAAVVLAVEPRIVAAVLNVGGLGTGRYPPEVDGFNFVSRVRTPTLMINGRYDVVFPYESSQVPMFELLGTPPEHKVHHTAPASHIVPQDELITLTLDWFDKYLGVPGRLAP
jgi:dienelactone hydrolase